MSAPITADRSSLNIAILTVSDRRTSADDTSGDLLADLATRCAHRCVRRAIVRDDKYQIRKILSDWIADPDIGVILTSGGTGFSDHDTVPEAAGVLFDKEVTGFGELFRQVSYAEIGGAAIQSRALAGYANRTLIFCLPGSGNACQTAWDYIIRDQLDSGQKPCNFANKVGAVPTRQEP